MPGLSGDPKIRERIATQVPFIRHWEVRHCSYADIDVGLATWFVDPPYQDAGKYYHHGSQALDFEHLGQWCQSREGQVMVCENEGATWLPFRPLAETKSTLSDKRSKEAIWTNTIDETPTLW